MNTKDPTELFGGHEILLKGGLFNVNLETLVGTQRFSPQECSWDKRACAFFRPRMLMHVVFSLIPVAPLASFLCHTPSSVLSHWSLSRRVRGRFHDLWQVYPVDQGVIPSLSVACLPALSVDLEQYHL